MANTTYIGGISVEFPFEPYKCQLTYMERVIQCLNGSQNGLLESPTGTGKTLSLLCSTLAWLQARKEKLKPKNVVQQNSNIESMERFGLPRIFYASRTHNQLTQVVREVNKTTYKYLNIAVIGSRDQLCINQNVCKETNNNLKTTMCRSLVSSKRCSFFNQYETNSHMKTHIDTYLQLGKVPDIEDMVTIGRKIGECPFYRSRSAFEQADLILLPYNYILGDMSTKMPLKIYSYCIDPRSRRANKIDLKGNIIIFDEAHNLENICEENASVSISTGDIGTCLREAKQALQMILDEEEQLRKTMDESSTAFLPDQRTDKQTPNELPKNDLAHFIELLHNLESRIDEINVNSREGKTIHPLPGRVFPGQFMQTLLSSAHFRPEMRDSVSALIDKVVMYMASQKSNTSHDIWRKKGHKLQEFSSFLSAVYADSFEMMALHKQPNSEMNNRSVESALQSKRFLLYVLANENDNNSLTLNYWCFSAAMTMRYLQSRGLRSMIITSGTLAPLDGFATELGIDFGVVFEGEHVINSLDQTLMVTLKYGPAQRLGASPSPVLLNGTFKNRTCSDYVASMGELLVRTASVVPQGMLVFFSSYSRLNACRTAWQHTTGMASVWHRLNSIKDIFVEPKSMGELRQILVDFDQSVVTGKGAVLLAVCRGKVSEGIDFSDSHCRAVFVIGIPYPPLMDARVCLKRSYLASLKHDKHKTTDPEIWYTTEGVRAVNQAIGRVIRHKDDFGAIILADSRFCNYDRHRFPAWLRPSIHNHESCQSFIGQLKTFFNRRGFSSEKIVAPTKTPSLQHQRQQKTIGVNRLGSLSSNFDEKFSFVKNTDLTNIDADLASIYHGKSPVVSVDFPNKSTALLTLPNYSSNFALEWRRTPQEYHKMLLSLATPKYRSVQSITRQYHSDSDLNALVRGLSQCLLPQHMEIFRSFYGFLLKDHKDEFVRHCKQLNL